MAFNKYYAGNGSTQKKRSSLFKSPNVKQGFEAIKSGLQSFGEGVHYAMHAIMPSDEEYMRSIDARRSLGYALNNFGLIPYHLSEAICQLLPFHTQDSEGYRRALNAAAVVCLFDAIKNSKLDVPYMCVPHLAVAFYGMAVQYYLVDADKRSITNKDSGFHGLAAVGTLLIHSASTCAIGFIAAKAPERLASFVGNHQCGAALALTSLIVANIFRYENEYQSYETMAEAQQGVIYRTYDQHNNQPKHPYQSSGSSQPFGDQYRGQKEDCSYSQPYSAQYAGQQEHGSYSQPYSAQYRG